MIGAKLICKDLWGVGASKILNNADNTDMPKGGEYQGMNNGEELNSDKISESKNYWIVCCKPEPFNNECGENGKHIGDEGWQWNKEGDIRETRNHKECFETMDIGDNVLCYVYQTQAFRGVFSVCGKDDDNVYLKFEYVVNIELDRITNNIIDLCKEKYSAFNKSEKKINQGTFFKSSKEQFKEIISLATQGAGVEKSIEEVSDKQHDLSLKAEFCGSGVWNMEQNDPDPFMQELNKQGLPYVVVEIESNGNSKILEDGRVGLA